MWTSLRTKSGLGLVRLRQSAQKSTPEVQNSVFIHRFSSSRFIANTAVEPNIGIHASMTSATFVKPTLGSARANLLWAERRAAWSLLQMCLVLYRQLLCTVYVSRTLGLARESCAVNRRPSTGSGRRQGPPAGASRAGPHAWPRVGAGADCRTGKRLSPLRIILSPLKLPQPPLPDTAGRSCTYAYPCKGKAQNWYRTMAHEK